MRLHALEPEVGHRRQGLTEAQEGLEFAERLLGTNRETRGVGPQR